MTDRTSTGALDIDPEHLSKVQAAIEEVRAGKLIILVDDEDRENEGDLCLAAAHATPEAINFMARFGRGLICLALTKGQVQKLQLPLMQAPGRGRPRLGTAFTVSIEAAHGVGTGISAADRTRTILCASQPNARPEDLVVPGHVFPLQASEGGVLVRAGQTEGAVDLARLAGLNPAGVICEIINDDGTMSRMPDLERFSAEHGLMILTIADLISYRLQTERLVRLAHEGEIELDRTGTRWRALVYETELGPRQLLALIKGQLDPEKPTLCRMHSGSTLADTFASTTSEGGRNLHEAIDAIEAEGEGVIVYLPPRGDLKNEILAQAAKSNPFSDRSKRSAEATPSGTLREYGLGAQVLRDLGLRQIRLLSNNPRKIAGIQGYGLEVVSTLPLVAMRETRSGQRRERGG